jgi:cytochrome c biogenesis protein CcdA
MELTALFFSFIAGTLSTLSPCVFPILPIIVSSSLQYSWKGLVALITGLSLSFAITGSLITYSAMVWDFDINVIKNVSAILLLIFGLIILVDKFNEKFVLLTSKLTNKGNEKLSTYDATGTRGQLFLGLLLGFVWTPCVGPTLGAAISFAIQGENLFSVFGSMLLFGLGAGLPLLILGLLSNKMVNRQKVTKNANLIKKILGVFLITMAVLILFGYDKVLETYLVDIMPNWLTDITTSF